MTSAVPDWLAGLRSALDEAMGAEFLEITPTHSRSRYPVAGNTQPVGLWHGGASCVVAETLASLSGLAETGPDGGAFGVDINATHHRGVREGWVNAEANALYLGGSTATYEVVLTDDAGRRVCTARVTLKLVRPS